MNSRHRRKRIRNCPRCKEMTACGWVSTFYNVHVGIVCRTCSFAVRPSNTGLPSIHFENEYHEALRSAWNVGVIVSTLPETLVDDLNRALQEALSQ